ncbi:hypothetical protein FS837_007885 [Tulasnella sp. UAMH 9824]|nr:hypothetical protein FS837_007885 [Tulasnella sp. UAMH 9824]
MKPQLNCWSLQGVLDCDDPELQALAKGGPGLGFAWLSFLLNQHEVRPPRGLDNEPVHESKAAILGVPQVILKSVPGLEEGSPRVPGPTNS